MWASRLCLGRLILSSPSRVKSQIVIPRTYSKLLKYVNNRITAECNSSQLLKTIRKSKWLVREQVTIPVEKTSLNSQKQLGIWLACCSGTVYIAVALGGYTRLTESGLSMVNWRFTFESYPKSEAAWVEEFKRYQEYPEYKQLKRDLTLDEFKTIWKTEYFHRNWGRFVGLTFLVPAAVFWLKGHLSPSMKKKILVFGSLIAAQGLMGWYMVKSGLEDRFHKESDIPRVSQYRLAAHLGLALTLYVGLLWSAFDMLLPAQAISKAQAGVRKLRMLSHSCKGLVFLTALSGAFVAGLDAGLVYNSFPKMGDKWVPDDILSFSPIYMNITENPTTVQFNHRILGITTFSLIMATCAISRKYILPSRARAAINTLGILACIQVLLGISTLVHYVPLSQAAAHQTGAVALLSAAAWLSHETKMLKYVPK